MGGCSAPNCTNASRKGFRCFSFPADPERRMLWRINTRRDDWIPTRAAKLCEVHFEKDQFELKRADGLIKLKPNAIPTIFDYSVPSRKKTRRKKKVVEYDGGDDYYEVMKINNNHQIRTCVNPKTASVISSSIKEIDNIRITTSDSEAYSEDHDVEIISKDDYHDDILSCSSHIASTDDHSCTSDEIKKSIDDDEVHYLSAADCHYKRSESDSGSVRSEENDSVSSFVNKVECIVSVSDHDLENGELHKKELRQLRLGCSSCELHTQELEDLRIENDKLKKKIEVLNSFLKTLLPEEDIRAFEEANFE